MSVRLKGKALEDHVKKVVSSYKKGMTIRAIANDTGRSYGAIHRVLTRSDAVTMRPRGGAVVKKRK